MSKKHKQTVSIGAFARAGSYDNDSSLPEYDWMKIASGEETVAPISNEDRDRSEQQLHEIEKLYPQYHTEMVPISKLIPAKEEWNFFPNQDKTILTDLMKNLVAYGQLSPALVWKQENGSYMILGGHTRHRAFQELHEIFTSPENNNPEMAKRFASMNCYVYEFDELDDVEARKIIIFDNVIRRENTTAIKAQAVINMNRLEKDTRSNRKWNQHRERIMDKVGKVMGVSGGTLKRLYQLRNLIPELWPYVDGVDGVKITIQLACAIALLDDDLQHYVYDKNLFANKLTAADIKLLSKAQTIEDIDHVYNTPSMQVITGRAEIDEKLPDGFVTFPIAAESEEEAYRIKSLILNALNNEQDISQKTKDIARKIFNM